MEMIITDPGERTAKAVELVKTYKEPTVVAALDCGDKEVMWMALREAWREIEELKEMLKHGRRQRAA